MERSDISNEGCLNLPYTNDISWSSIPGANCDDSDIESYKLYYSPTINGEYRVLEERHDKAFTSFSHNLTDTISGCYFVEVFDENETNKGISDTVCVESCPYYELPNSFSPNGDNINDTFVPFRCPRFIKRVEFEVRSRWGDVVYTSNDDIYLNWDGKNTQASDLPTGVYYYSAKVIINTTSGEEATFSNLKGTIHLLRDKK